MKQSFLSRELASAAGPRLGRHLLKDVGLLGLVIPAVKSPEPITKCRKCVHGQIRFFDNSSNPPAMIRPRSSGIFRSDLGSIIPLGTFCQGATRSITKPDCSRKHRKFAYSNRPG